MDLRVLILGSGGREHALAWKLAQSARVERLFVCPGNGGTAALPKTANVSFSGTNFEELVKFATENEVNLVVPGPEQPLVDGVEAYFRKVGIPVFGPTAKAARMEGSKAFAKDFMARNNIPTAAFRTFAAHDVEGAVDYVKTCGHDVVLKASGLAGGKGVLIPANVDEAVKGLQEIMVDKAFGSAGDEVVVEELLTGPEISVLAFSDGYTVVPLPAAQDHKRIGEGDVGPNTGGMGVYAPAPVATPEVMQRVLAEALLPTVHGMRREGFPFVGMLFTGLMLTPAGPRVLEYNVRFGDPETEALMLLLSQDTDLAEVLLACAERRLDSVKIDTRPGSAVSVILASQGYPGSYPKGKAIEIGAVPSGVTVFHAGTSSEGNQVVTSGGRVIAVTAYASTLPEAVKLAYAGVDQVHFEGKTFRRDIAHRALNTPAASAPAGLTYAQAGVSVDAGNALVERIKPYVRATRRPGADAEIGGFGGVFDLRAVGYADPVLVSGTDGVGTKLHVAKATGAHGTVGIDLVAMSVNDLLVQGAEPLYFLDYFGCSALDVDVAAEVVRGIAKGCEIAGCALIGGETAEMPGMYQKGDYDLAGFAVGAVERSQLLPTRDIQAGDILLGLPSAGLHSNGFSLARKVLSRSGLDYTSSCPWDAHRTVGQEFMEPTRIYVKQLLPLVKAGGLIKGMVHITGGGFVENIPRVLPKGVGCFVDAGAWALPPVFKFLMREGGVAPLEMARTFNNGIGMVLVVGAGQARAVMDRLASEGAVQIGALVEGEGVEMRNLETWAV